MADDQSLHHTDPKQSGENLSERTISSHGGFCCAPKQYIMHNCAFTSVFDIIPRVIIIKKQKFHLSNRYEMDLQVKNNGLYSREIDFGTDSVDTYVRIIKRFRYRYIEPDEIFDLKIIVEPKAKKDKNRRRHVYIYVTHPNVIFEIPIIVLGSTEEGYPSIPAQIMFRPSAPNSLTCYEFALYNPTDAPANAKLTTTFKGLKIIVAEKSAPKADYIKVLLILCVTNLEPVKDFIRIKFGKVKDLLEISFYHGPVPIDPHLSVSHLHFPEVRYSLSEEQNFLICNDAEYPATVSMRFIEEGDVDIKSDSSPERTSDQSEDNIKKSYQKHPDDIDEDESKTSINGSGSSDLEFNPTAYKHFKISEFKNHDMSANSRQKIKIRFEPNSDVEMDSKLESPYFLLTKLLVKFDYLDYSVTKFIIVTGVAKGPDVLVSSKAIDLGKIYIGEEHCAEVFFENLDDMINAEVVYEGQDNKGTIFVHLTPESGILDILPLEKEHFILSIYTKMVGKFLLKLTFRIKNGHRHYILLKGNSQTLALKSYPPLLDFGNLSICVPQVRFILLINPCSVPVTAQLLTPEDGDETPLVLNIADIDELLPITVQDPVKQLMRARADEDLSSVKLSDSDFKYFLPDYYYEAEGLTGKSSLQSYKSVEDHSDYSVEFQYEILEPIPEMAQQVVKNIKDKKILEREEVEKSTIEEILKIFLDTKYFHEMDLYKNYAFMDWSGIPSDPKEIYVSKEVIYLQPNTGKKLAVLLIPNKSGVFYRSLQCRVCPEYKFEHCESLGEGRSSFVPSDHMTSKIELIYECIIPKMIWNNEITLDDQKIYLGEEYYFEISFENTGKVGGFVFFDVVPHCEKGIMSFVDGIWKFYVEDGQSAIAHCQVKFCDAGYIKLHGLVRVLGCTCSCVFSIAAEVLPTKIIGLPDIIHINTHICNKGRFYIYFENGSPIGHGLRYSLEKETDTQFIYPHGARLNPEGQGTYLTIFAFFRDPGRYYNTLHIDLQYLKRVSIPIIFTVTGMPIFFEPLITDAYNMGTLTTITECEFQLGEPKHEQNILVKNCGSRPYHIVISKIRAGNGYCELPSKSARVDINPKSFTLHPKESLYLTITAWAYEEQYIQNDFLIKVVDTTKPQRFENQTLSIRTNFVHPKLAWNPHKLLLEHFRTHAFKEQSIEDTVSLINSTDALIENINLEALGPIKIKENFEDPFITTFMVSLKPLEHKEITILLDKRPLQDIHCHKIESRIAASKGERDLRSLSVRVVVRTPSIEILPERLILFVNKRESQTLIELKNTGCMDAQYKWKKLCEELIYVDSEDDEKEFIAEILSDILHMLDIAESVPDEVEGENLSERYRRYRCKLRRLEDEIGIRTILDEIIDNLDLEHKRYKIHFDEEDEEFVIDDFMNDLLADIVNDVAEEVRAECVCEEEQSISSAKTIGPATLNEILRKLKLEDSYEITDPSSSYCSANRFAYFYEKMGIVKRKETSFALIHLPGVRKGHELRVKFELVVIGGESEYFTLILANLRRTVELSRHHVYIGSLPWYEMYFEKVRCTNLTPYLINIKIEKLGPKIKHKERFIEGFLSLMTDKYFEIRPYDRRLIKMEGALGFAHEFARQLRLIINGGDEMRIIVRGQGIMPILSETSGLAGIEQTDYEIYEEYLILQKIFYYEMFRAYREFGEDKIPPYMEEEEESKELFERIDKEDSDFELADTIVEKALSEKPQSLEGATQKPKDDADDGSSESVSSSFEEFGEEIDYSELRRMKMLLDTYVVVKYIDVPNKIILQQAMETEKFKRRLWSGSDALDLLNLVYKEYWKFESTHDYSMPLNLKHFTIQPLPFQMHGYKLDMGTIQIGRIHKYEFTLQFLGPGQLIAQARVPIEIPGFFISLYADNVPEDVVVLNFRPERKPETVLKPYRNMWERIMDAETDPKLQHAHSFDIDFRLIHMHKRNVKELTALDRMYILEYYSSLNRSVYLEQKHHPILSKIYAQGNKLYSGCLLHVIILFKPEAKYYAHEQFFDDYLYIDLHMGPILPIAMKGQLMKL